MQHLRQRRETVRRAAGIRNDRVFRRIVNVVVDPDANGRVGIFRRRADEDPFRACLADMQFRLVAAGEKSGRFQHDFHAQIFPGQIPRVAFLQNLNLVTAHDDVLLVVTDLAVEFPVDRIPFQQMRERVGVGQIVDRADAFDVAL